MATQTESKPQATNLEALIGTAVHEDKAALLDGRLAPALRELLEQRGVLVFPQIHFSDEEQIAFTKTLGTVADEGEKGIYKVTLDSGENPQAEYLKGAFYWHIDGTMSKVPILASLLSGRRLAPTGGETQFANTYAAWDALPEEEKRALEGLKVVHSFEVAQRYVNPEPSFAQLQGWQALGENALPLVWTHRSGRKSLVLGSTASYVVGMDHAQSTALLVRLREWATQPHFVYQHTWALGDLVIWDNTGTMHRAMPYALDSGRMMHRTKLEGEEAFA